MGRRPKGYVDGGAGGVGGGASMAAAAGNPLVDTTRYFLTAPIQEAQTLFDVVQAILAHRWQETVAAGRRLEMGGGGGGVGAAVGVAVSVPAAASVKPSTDVPVNAAPEGKSRMAQAVTQPVTQAPRRRRVGAGGTATPTTREEDVPLPGMTSTTAPTVPDLPPQTVDDEIVGQ